MLMCVTHGLLVEALADGVSILKAPCCLQSGCLASSTIDTVVGCSFTYKYNCMHAYMNTQAPLHLLLLTDTPALLLDFREVTLCRD